MFAPLSTACSDRGDEIMGYSKAGITSNSAA